MGGVERFKKSQRHHNTIVRKMCIITFMCLTYNFLTIDRENMNGFNLTNLSKIFLSAHLIQI